MRKILLSLVALALAGCQTTTTDDVIKIGYIGPLTGDAASYGADTLNGMKVKAQEINAAGGINGKTVQIVAEDGRCTGSDAGNAAQKLINIDKVVAIIGGQCSSETLAIAPIAEQNGIVVISPVSSSPDITAAGDYIFRVYPSDELKTQAMANYFAEQDYAKVAMITENTDYAMAFRDALKAKLPADAIIFDEVDEQGSKDYRTLITRLQGEDFDVFFPNGQTDATVAAMIEQFRELGLTQPIVGHDAMDSLVLVDLLGDTVEGAQLINTPSAGEGGDFQAKLEALASDVSIIAFAAHAYDATGVLASVLAEVDPSDEAAIRDALYDLPSYNGITGTFSFDENGDVLGLKYDLKTFQNGQIVKVRDITVN